MKKFFTFCAAGLFVASVALAQPALRVETPGNGATVGNVVTLTGTAAPYSRVLVTGDLAGDVKADKNGNWLLELDAQTLSSGDPVDLSVVARDARGNMSKPLVLSFPRSGGPAASTTTTDRTRLAVNVSSPVNKAKVAQTFTLNGTATPGTKIEVTGDAVGNTSADENGNWTLNMSTKAPVNSDLVLRVRAKNIYNMESNEVVLNLEVNRAGTTALDPTNPNPGSTPAPGFGTIPAR